MMGRKLEEKVIKFCEICNKEIKITPARLKNKHHTCSKFCLGILAKKRYSQKVQLNCSNCGKSIFYKKSIAKHVLNPSCSPKCKTEIQKKIRSGAGNSRFLNLSELEKFFWNKTKCLKRNAAVRKIHFDLSHIDLLNIYVGQNEKCFYSDIPLNLYLNQKNTPIKFDTLSVDRVDSNKGYIKDNIVLCLNCINMFKSNHDMIDIKHVFKAIMLKEMNNCSVFVKKLFSDAKLPIKKDPVSSGYDLFVHRFEEFDDHIKIYSGISLQPDSNYYFELFSRSSVYKQGLVLYNGVGVIDNSYTGEIIGVFLKTPEYDKEMNPIQIGDRYMQIVPKQLIQANFFEVDELNSTKRGTGGFGSTGR